MSENNNSQFNSLSGAETLPTESTTTERNGTSRRGFASMDRERQREIARKGGRAAHEQGVAHQWSSEEARAAGRKGGQSSRGTRTANGEPMA